MEPLALLHEEYPDGHAASDGTHYKHCNSRKYSGMSNLSCLDIDLELLEDL
jgi:hypothetical protein